jgi:gliding motility-associated-like protein
MKRTIFFILLIMSSTLQAQQIKRWTLASSGANKVAPPFHVSWSTGNPPATNTLKAEGKASLRQNYQQPPDIYNNPAGCLITATFNYTAIPSTVCGLGYDFEYTGSQLQGVNILWDFGEGATPRTSTLPNPIGVTYYSVGIKMVTMTVKQGQCTKSSAKVLNINQNQVGFGATVTAINNKCFGDKKGSISISPSGGSGLRTYKWSSGETTSALSNVASGRYQVTITDSSGCRISIDTAILQPNSPLAVLDTLFPATCKTDKDGYIHLATTGGTKPYRYLWDNGSTSNKLDSISAGIYKVSIIDTNNCKLDTLFEVKQRCRQRNDSTDVYDVFTPNGDNVNETWVVKDIEYHEQNETYVFNRWGQLVFSKKGYKNEWRGLTNDNKELPSAAYYYVIYLRDDKDTILSGSITIIR